MLKIRRFLEYHQCCSCGFEFLSQNVMKINNKEYICRNCRMENCYSTKNSAIHGKKTSISFSFEFETGSRNPELYELQKYDFIGCSDGSIAGSEWKSPIYYNRKIFHNVCRKINKFAKFVDRSCGTHLHVATDYKHLMEKYKNELFQPILNEMKSHREQTIRFWGRYFGHYCEATLYDGYRYNAFNTVSSVQTLEFRLLKFRNAEQYIRACDFCIDTTKYINAFIGREGFDSEQAKKIGNIIAQKYKEVVKNV